jgi:hypothetical protein
MFKVADSIFKGITTQQQGNILCRCIFIPPNIGGLCFKSAIATHQCGACGAELTTLGILI